LDETEALYLELTCGTIAAAGISDETATSFPAYSVEKLIDFAAVARFTIRPSVSVTRFF